MNYQAVVFAGGRGSRMPDLTTTIPKCLLPVANVPMIVYPLAMLQNAKFQHAFVLVPAKCTADVRRILVQHNISLKFDFVEVPDDEDLGTAEALRLLLHRISKNVLLLSCDFICDFPLNKFIDWHDSNGSSLSMLLTRNAVQGNAPGPKTKRKIERDLIAVQSNSDRLAYLCGETDFEDDFVSLHKNLLSRFNRLHFTTKLTDCHAYLINRCLLELINIIPNEFVSLKTDLLPFVIKLQHYSWTSIPKSVQDVLNSLPGFNGENCFDLKCLAYIMNNDEFSICARLNNSGSYFETNKQVIKFLSKFFTNPPMAQFIQPFRCTNAQMGADSFLGANTTAGKRVQIKRSIVGRHCSLGENCKLNNCVIMDHVRIGDGSVLVNCIICHSSEIAEKCDLKDCLLTTNQRVASGTKLSAETVGGDNRMFEI